MNSGFKIKILVLKWLREDLLADIRRVDLAEVGIAKGRRLGVMRIHHKLLPTAEKDTAAATLIELSLNKDNDWTAAEIRDLLARLLEDESPGWPLNEQQRDAIRHLKERKLSELSVIPYPDHEGFVISSRVLMPEKDAEEMDTEDSDADALLETKSSQAQELSHHTGDVLARIESSFTMFPVGPWRDALVTAAELHDWGKADSRFQALLRSTTLFAAMASGVMLAKSSSIPSSAAARRAASERAVRAGAARGSVCECGVHCVFPVCATRAVRCPPPLPRAGP